VIPKEQGLLQGFESRQLNAKLNEKVVLGKKSKIQD